MKCPYCGYYSCRCYGKKEGCQFNWNKFLIYTSLFILVAGAGTLITGGIVSEARGVSSVDFIPAIIGTWCLILGIVGIFTVLARQISE